MLITVCLHRQEFTTEKIKELFTFFIKVYCGSNPPFSYENTLLLLKTGVISLSTQGMKGANSFSQKWNRLSLGIHTGFINVPRYLSSVAYGSEITNKKIYPNLKNLSMDFIGWFKGFTVYTRGGLFLDSKNW